MREKASAAFLQKSSEKRCFLLSRISPVVPTKLKKVFWFFFSRKNRVLGRPKCAC
jgi:hypothetical protein